MTFSPALLKETIPAGEVVNFLGTYTSSTAMTVHRVSNYNYRQLQPRQLQTGASVNMNIDYVMSGHLIHSHSADSNLTTPTAADIIAAMSNVTTRSTHRFTVDNSGITVATVATIVAGTGVTLEPSTAGRITIGPGQAQDFLIEVTAANAVTIHALGNRSARVESGFGVPNISVNDTAGTSGADGTITGKTCTDNFGTIKVTSALANTDTITVAYSKQKARIPVHVLVFGLTNYTYSTTATTLTILASGSTGTGDITYMIFD